MQTVTYPVSVTPSASAPVANVTPTSATVLQGVGVSLSGSGSTDPSGLPMQFTWSQTSGPAAGVFSSTDSATTTFGSATPGNYTLELQVSDENAAATPVSATVTVELPAPNGKPNVISSNSPPGVMVHWTPVTGATSYKVYASTDGTTFTPVGGVNGGSNSQALIVTLADGTYYFTVAACANGVCGVQSPISNSFTLLLPPPVPMGLTISPSGTSTTGNYTLSWNASATATSYQIQNSGGHNGNPGSNTSQLFSNNNSIGTYTYTVEACNSSGCSAASAPITETVLITPGAPNANTTSNPTGVQLSGFQTNGATSYQIYESTDDATFTLVQTVTSNNTVIPISVDGTYYFTVAFCVNGTCSAQSPASTGVTVVVPPPVPTGLAMTPSGTSTTGDYTLSWNAAATATSYQIPELWRAEWEPRRQHV